MFRFIALFFMLLTGLCSTASAQVYHKMQGTTLWLAPPEGYEISRHFTGFTNEKTGGSILVIALPAEAVKETYRQFQNEATFIKAMKAQGFDITSQLNEKTRDGLDFKLYSGDQQDHGLVYHRWLTMLIAPQGSYIVSLQSPQNNDLNPEIALNVFRTARIFGTYERQEEIAALPFTMKVLAPFAVETVVMGNTVQLAIPGEEKTPHIFISMDLDRIAPGYVESAEKRYLSSIAPAFTVQQGAIEKTVPFAGTSGRLLEGIGKTATGDQDFLLYTAVNNEGQTFYLHATADKGMLAQYRSIIEAIAMSLAPNKTQ